MSYHRSELIAENKLFPDKTLSKMAFNQYAKTTIRLRKTAYFKVQ